MLLVLLTKDLKASGERWPNWLNLILIVNFLRAGFRSDSPLQHQNLACAYHTVGVYLFGEQINPQKLIFSTNYNQNLIKSS